jgi:hypothetical protein
VKYIPENYKYGQDLSKHGYEAFDKLLFGDAMKIQLPCGTLIEVKNEDEQNTFTFGSFDIVEIRNDGSTTLLKRLTSHIPYESGFKAAMEYMDEYIGQLTLNDVDSITFIQIICHPSTLDSPVVVFSKYIDILYIVGCNDTKRTLEDVSIDAISNDYPLDSKSIVSFNGRHVYIYVRKLMDKLVNLSGELVMYDVYIKLFIQLQSCDFILVKSNTYHYDTVTNR